MAVSATLGQLGPRYGIGTNVSVYLRSQWARGVLSGAPSGGAVAGPVAVDTNGNATFAGLNPDTEYIIYANVSGVDVYTAFFAGTGGSMSSARDVEVVSTVGGAGGAVDTELPAAAALADATANPTVPSVGALLEGFDGTNWSRARLSPAALGTMASTGWLGSALVGIAGGGNMRPIAAAAGLTDADAGNLLATALGLFNGATFDRMRTPVKFIPFASTAITAGTGATIWTPAAGKKFRLMGWLISTSVAGQLIFGDNLVGTVIARSEAVAAAGVTQPGAGIGNGILSAAANNVLKLDGPTGNVAGMVWGTEE